MSPATRKGQGAPSLVISALLLAGFSIGGCTGPSHDGQAISGTMADGRLWYVGDGALGQGQTRLFLFNPGEEVARVELRFYRERNAPQTFTREVPAGKVVESDVAELDGLPHGEPFWLVTESATPIFPQLRQAYFAANDPVPDALLSVAPYPGPLSNETTWIYPDCFVGGAEHWFENETITILNPGRTSVMVRLTYLSDGQAAVEEIGIPAQRMVALDAGARHPRLHGGSGDDAGVGGNYALRIEADASVMTQMTRRARLLGASRIVGARSAIGFPLSDAPPRVWHYPGGYDARPAPGGGEPWNLLFLFNPDPVASVNAELIFHGTEGRRSTYPDFAIPPSTSDLRWLHHWLGEYVTREPWALTVHASGPLVAELTSAEFETRDDACPEAMTAVNLCAEPLAGRASQWLGIAPIGTSPEGGFWHQHYALLNPGAEPASVTLSFQGLAGETRRHTLVIPSAAVARVDAGAIEGLPAGEPFAVRADAVRPLCAQTVVRVTAGEQSYTRAIHSFVGVPARPDRPR